MTIGDQPKIRGLYHGLPMSRVKTHQSVSKVIGGKRPTFRQLIIRNYEPPEHPLYTAIASQMPLTDLFDLASSPYR
jgi:hypothetical protein